MKIAIAFTIEIEPASLEKAREFMAVHSNPDLRLTLCGEAENYLVDYLDRNGIKVNRT